MLEIQEKFDTVGYEELANKAGSAELHITEALDRGEVIGFIAYSYGTDRTVVYDYDDCGDMMLCDGLVRSVMLKSVLKGINHMLFELPDNSKFETLKKLRFVVGDSRQCADLDSFMNGCEHCKNKKD
ncbi:hypothetical protein [Ruminococcus flavefaciens]|uniref:hypothetical protein n=1 Tax=Ruminococcus flavefaciens TaxID=1265 RepID=UPI0026F14469|nr:hypothetical protein [Ruminococcus flavefaciens]MDD7516119.1 hypothetical protein [Ruminococcus flavefaciens]MDY5692202.1 hypothetical protein [Ruminococcus flavefaciens]